ncbi:IGF-like family receptor 1 isoform X1 [Oncorhynchus mykiss]|uniref:IGF-like family receptor 1 n=1 Tax=Oncorhynchus mykiss TaxID=8022 RepID=A0A8C7RUQ1_ONCMY|nr:IGF-like family receptor 1 isoform X1 [Oncorhynchus mykiss]
MGHYSDNCSDDLDTFWDESRNKCVPCHQHPQHPIQPGHEFSPNCGMHDDGGRSEIPYRKCAAQTFNNGSFVKCQPCSSCPPTHQKLSECNITTDTQCCGSRDQTGCREGVLGTTTQQVQQSTMLKVQMSTSNPTTAKHTDQTIRPPDVNHKTAWIVLTVILVLAVLAFLLFIYIKKRRGRSRAFCIRGKENKPCFMVSLKDCLPSDNILYTNQQSWTSRRTAAVNEEVALLQSETRNLEDILSPNLQSAPLQTVLDNLDVLEELVILLDPEIPGVKNTSHLASRCSFPATWITYTYSMRDSKSPLRAVLEGVTTKHPDWTVGQLARLLREMDRNDAVVVLTKLTLFKVV